MLAKGFLSEEHRAMVFAGNEPKPLLEALARYQPPKIVKWIAKEEIWRSRER